MVQGAGNIVPTTTKGTRVVPMRRHGSPQVHHAHWGDLATRHRATMGARAAILTSRHHAVNYSLATDTLGAAVSWGDRVGWVGS